MSAGSDGPTFDEDIGAQLSAYLDGEVSAAEEREVRALLERSADARAELDGLRHARAALRGLPEVEPPPGFLDHPERLLDGVELAADRDDDGLRIEDETGLAPRPAPAPPSVGFRPRSAGAPAPGSPAARRHRSGRWGARLAAAAGVAAVVVVLLLGITPLTDRFVPPVDAFAARHGAMEAGEADVPNPTDMDFADASDVAIAEAGIPATMAGDFERVHGFVGRNGMVHAVFSDGRAMVSVYSQPGAVEWSAMPTGGATMDVDGDPAAAMELRTEGVEEGVVVVDRDGRVFTVVSGGGHDEMMAVVHALPDPDRSIMERLGDGCRSIVESFAAGG